MSLVGMVVLIGLAVLLSKSRKDIRLRTVGGAFALQFAFGAFVLYIPFGKKILISISDAVANVIAYGNEGINFLFGDLTATFNFGFIFALRVLPVIIFFSALISVLYYVGIMKWVINILGAPLVSF